MAQNFISQKYPNSDRANCTAKASNPSQDTTLTPYAKGLVAQKVACKFLNTRKYKILAENYHSRFGEIDIIAAKGPEIVFYEIKSSIGPRSYSLLELLTKRKFQKIYRSAQYWLLKNAPQHEDFSFGIVTVCFQNNSLTRIQKIELVENLGKISEIPF